MKYKKFSIVCLVLVLIFITQFISGCGKERKDIKEEYVDEVLLQHFDPSLPDGTVEFTDSILDFAHFNYIIPLGNINPPGHSFPTDHIYFNTNGPEKRPVYTPTGGKILNIERTGLYGDGSIRIGVTNTMTYYLGHIIVEENLQVGDIVLAGEQVGINGNTACVDFGLLNKNINNGFVCQKQALTTLYGDKPLSYYIEPLRTQLYEKVKPPMPNSVEYPDYVYDGEVTDGEFAIDLAGTLRGNWFKEGSLELDWYGWENTLAFGYDVFYTDQIRIGIGTSQFAFALKNEDSPIRPENVNTTSGIVVYYLYNANNTTIGLPTGDRIGLMMIQMLSDARIKLEIFDDTTSSSREFTSAATIYVR